MLCWRCAASSARFARLSQAACSDLARAPESLRAAVLLKVHWHWLRPFSRAVILRRRSVGAVGMMRRVRSE
eukprot:15455218-Alexandrium_andersonii.AAC.1